MKSEVDWEKAPGFPGSSMFLKGCVWCTEPVHIWSSLTEAQHTLLIWTILCTCNVLDWGISWKMGIMLHSLDLSGQKHPSTF